MKVLSKILSVLLALGVLLCSFTAYATDFIFDESQQQYISKEESDQLDTVAKNYRDGYGLGIYYYYANQVNGNVVDFSEDYYRNYCNNDENGVLLVITDDEYYVYLKGDAVDMFPNSDDIWDTFSCENTYYEGVAKYINYVGTEMIKYYAEQPVEFLPDDELEAQPIDDSADNTALAYNTLKSDGSLVFDNYDLLSDDEEKALEAKLAELSQKHSMDIAVVIVDGLDGKSSMEFADDYYDYNGYGQGDTKDGVVLLLSMADRDWHFSTKGKAIDAFTDKNQDYMFSSDKVLGYFGNDDWTGGFNCFAEECDKCLTAYENGDKYIPFAFTDFLPYLAVSAVVGLVIALIFVKVNKNKHKTVVKKAGANDYLVAGSLQVTQSYDAFAYRNVTRVKKANDSNSGGSSTHTSSSGATHGGSGGKF